MYRIKILSVGKTKESWLQEAIEEYSKRLTGVVIFESVWLKTDEQLISAVEKESHLICLDPHGRQFSSEEFSSFLLKELESGGCRLCLVIGGAEGLPNSIKLQGKLISLSKMTFTHQITRLILFEQIYRALEIARGSEYHK